MGRGRGKKKEFFKKVMMATKKERVGEKNKRNCIHAIKNKSGLVRRNRHAIGRRESVQKIIIVF